MSLGDEGREDHVSVHLCRDHQRRPLLRPRGQVGLDLGAAEHVLEDVVARADAVQHAEHERGVVVEARVRNVRVNLEN